MRLGGTRKAIHHRLSHTFQDDPDEDSKMINFRDFFAYDGSNLFWSIDIGKRIKAGMISGHVDDKGYRRLRVKGKRYYVHRVIWEMHYGEIPEGMEIDHINHNRLDNRIENLRLVTKEENQRNKSKYNNNKSGYPGIDWIELKKSWRVRINTGGHYRTIGLFNEIGEAVKARQLALISAGFHENHK